MTTARSQGRTEPSLEHAEARFDLPSLSILGGGPVGFEALAEAPTHHSRRRVGRTASSRRDDPPHAEFVMQERMMVFGVVAGVGQERIE